MTSLYSYTKTFSLSINNSKKWFSSSVPEYYWQYSQIMLCHFWRNNVKGSVRVCTNSSKSQASNIVNK